MNLASRLPRQQTYKSHRGATNFDSAYINAIVNDMKSENSGDKSIEQQ